jgi:hypothetical protein
MNRTRRIALAAATLGVVLSIGPSAGFAQDADPEKKPAAK